MAPTLPVVEDARLRLSPRRRLVLEILQQSHEHLDAESVYQRARSKDPRISLATVYRTLALFKALGLVEEHQFGEAHGHFETVQSNPHYHFTCSECGQVSEFEAPDVAALVGQLCQDSGQRLDQVRLELSGLCSACLKKQRPQAGVLALKPLSQMPAGGHGRISKFDGGHEFAARVIAMGLPLGSEVSVIQNFGHGPLLVGIQGVRIALGRGEAARIQVEIQ